MEAGQRQLLRLNQAIGHIEQFVRHGRDEFMNSMAVRHAVLWNLELVSLAARHLSEHERKGHPEIDWEHLRHLCHDVIGNPWEVDSNKVWQCVTEELPDLKHRVRAILAERSMK